MKDFETELTWWGNLSLETRRRLLAAPTVMVPADVISEVLAAGSPADGDRWIGPGQDSVGFDLPTNYKEFITRLKQGTLGS